MKTTIYRIYENEVVDVCRNLFERRFIDHQLSEQGKWFGKEAQQLQLTNPVSFAAIFNLFTQHEPYDVLSREATQRVKATKEKAKAAENGNIAGWKMMFNAGENLSTLWALGHKGAQERLAKGQKDSVETALMQFQNSLADLDGGLFGRQGSTRPIFATFFAGADRQQSPCLHTTVLIPRRHLSHDKKVSEIKEAALEKAHKQVDAFYANSLTNLFGDEEKMNLPRNSLRPVVPGPGQERLVASGHLFFEWRELAKKAGQNGIEAASRELDKLGFEQPKIENATSRSQIEAPSTTSSNGHQKEGHRSSHSH